MVTDMVAVKTPSRGYRGLGFGSATRTSYENIGATSMVAGMQESCKCPFALPPVACESEVLA